LESRQGEAVGSILGDLVVDAVVAPKPEKYTYGKAQQSIFMTSLKNVLTQQQVFNRTEITTDAEHISPKDILITIFFKTTRIEDRALGGKITLDVDVIITADGKSTFKRSYVVESTPDQSFATQQSDVSKKLLRNVISALEQWHQKTK
jgi:hypothetical protein